MIPGIVASILRRPILEYPLLLTNPDAETNTGSTTTAAPIGWTSTAGMPRVRVDESGRSPPQGLSIFDGGTSATSTAYQRIDLEANEVPLATIDDGYAFFICDWWGGTYNQRPLDSPRLEYVWLNSSLATIRTDIDGNFIPITAVSETMFWDEFQDAFPVPAGARYLDIRMTFLRGGGTNNDAAVDWIRPRIRDARSPASNYQIFTTSGTFNVPVGVSKVDVLIVAGGGSGFGGLPHNVIPGGGGGAGGVVILESYSVTPEAPISVVIGAGGIGVDPGSSETTADAKGTSGGNSSFDGQVAVGGGAGGINNTITADSGGSGGGSQNADSNGAGTSGQGNAGGIGSGNSNNYRAGGGGGYRSAGVLGEASYGGYGGYGLNIANTNFIGAILLGAPDKVAGGGGGGVYRASGNPAGGPGKFGGGDGGTGGANNYANRHGGDAVANTGSGGGGGATNSSTGATGSSKGGNGADGIVIVRWL